jgi:glyoxylase-like metal-dependent hydrolase (beta-lactamase superfamily II)
MSGWEALAIRYGTRPARRGEVFYRFDAYGEPDGPLTMDYYFWVLRRDGRTVVVDSGFDPAVAERMGRTCLIAPADALALLEIDPAAVEHVIVTHLHYDHVGNLDLFPNAELLVSGRELSFWTGPLAARRQYAAHVVAEEVARVARAEAEGRVRRVGDELQALPGIRLRHVGGHSPGQLIVDLGEIVLTSDAMHYYEELELDRPPSVLHDLADCYRALDLLRGLDGELVAGHDPLVRERFHADPGDAVIRLRAATTQGTR